MKRALLLVLLASLGCPPPDGAPSGGHAADPLQLELTPQPGYAPGRSAVTKPEMREPALSDAPLSGVTAELPPGPQRWGTLTLAENRFPFAIVGEGGAARLWLDSDQDGDLRDEEPRPGGNASGYAASLVLPLRYGDVTRELPIWFYVSFERGRCDYYAQGHWRGELKLGEQRFAVYTFEAYTDGDFSDHPVWIDVNGDGTLQDHEQVAPSEVIQLGERSLRLASVSRDGARVSFAPADERGRELAVEVEEELSVKPFQATSLQGRAVAVGPESLGKVVLLDFWATWCGPCMKEMPHVKELWERHGAREDFLLVGISFDTDLETLREVVARDGLDWPQCCDGEGARGEVARAYAVTGIPTTILIDRAGTVRARGLRGDALAERVRELLAER